MQEYRSCKLQGSVSRTSLQIHMQNFVSTNPDSVTSNKKMKHHFHQNLRYKVLSSQRGYGSRYENVSTAVMGTVILEHILYILAH